MPAMRRLAPVPFTSVSLQDRFLKPRQDTNRHTTLPLEYELCRKTGRLGAFTWKTGQPHEPHIYWDSDLGKWIEAAGYSLATHPDPGLEQRVDRIVDEMAACQRPDGYLNSHFNLVNPDKRWTNLKDAHELYCAGHLMEGAVAYARATGKRKLLDILCRYADHIGKTFGRGKGQKRGYCGHPEIELALVKLFRVTGEQRHLDLAAYFVDERGRKPHFFDQETGARGEKGRKRPGGEGYGYFQVQAHEPVRKQADAVGHSVRALYLYSGMADVAAETGDASLVAACRNLWKSVTDRRMYLTGGVGSSRHGERFTVDFDLPNETAYAETCANIALVFFGHRMLQMEADAGYADIMERALYNGVLSGVGLDGRSFFYANPLLAHPRAYAGRSGDDHSEHTDPVRQEWFGCACCPPNIARLLASVGEYVYSTAPGALYVHLYAGGRSEAEVDGRKVRIVQETDYPWGDTVRLSVTPETSAVFTLALRIPGWCREAQLTVNGKRFAARRVKGYALIRRCWAERDRVELRLSMPIERIEARPEVRADCGKVALQRGPLVYCLEECDNGADLADLTLPQDAPLTARFKPKLLGGVVTIEGQALRRDSRGWGDALYRPVVAKTKRVAIRAIPYCLWANRQPGEMIVWIRALGNPK